MTKVLKDMWNWVAFIKFEEVKRSAGEGYPQMNIMSK